MATKLVIDCTTGEAIGVDLTSEEIAQREADYLLSQEPPPPNPFAILRSLLEYTEGPEDLIAIMDAQFELMGG